MATEIPTVSRAEVPPDGSGAGIGGETTPFSLPAATYQSRFDDAQLNLLRDQYLLVVPSIGAEMTPNTQNLLRGAI